MQEFLTIGEIAKLFNISLHQVRYYEEKGVLVPKQDERNGYRLYAEKEVYKLAHVLMLRKFNIPVAQIKQCFNEYTDNDYISLMERKRDEINEQIKELKKFKDYAERFIQRAREIKNNVKKYEIKHIEERKLNEIMVNHYDKDYSIKDFYHSVKGTLDLFETDIITLYDEKCSYMCIASKKKNILKVHRLQKGNYLCRTFIADTYEIFLDEINKMYVYAGENNIELTGRIIAIEDSIISLMYNNHNFYELQLLIKD